MLIEQDTDKLLDILKSRFEKKYGQAHEYGMERCTTKIAK